MAFYATSEEEDDVLTFYCEELPRRGFSFTGGSVDCARQREPSARIAERILSFTDGETAQVELMLAASNIRELRSQVGVEPPGDRPTVFKLFVRRGRGFAP